MSSQPERALSFGSAAKLYDDARPSYPAEFVRWVLTDLPDGPKVLDLAAGTGKLTRVLHEYVADVVAVEPDPGMRKQFSASSPNIPILEGKDTSIPLPDSSVDAVFVAQAWHWFDAAAASAEILRVLRPGGVLVIAWNVKDDSIGWVRDYCDLFEIGARASLPRRTPEVAWGVAQQRDFPWSQQRTVEQLVDLALSTSWSLSLPQSARRVVAEKIREQLRALPGAESELELPYITQASRFVAPA